MIKRILFFTERIRSHCYISLSFDQQVIFVICQPSLKHLFDLRNGCQKLLTDGRLPPARTEQNTEERLEAPYQF